MPRTVVQRCAAAPPQGMLCFYPTFSATSSIAKAFQSRTAAHAAAMDLPKNLYRALGLHRKVGPITALHIFDFDGTLVRTPGPDEGKHKYFQETGRQWSGGWWGRPASLSPPVVESPFPASRVVVSVFDEMENVMTRSQTAVGIVVTGRIKPCRDAVIRILDEICIARNNDTVAQGQSFVNHNAVVTHPGGSRTTLEFKMQFFEELLTCEPLVNCAITDLHVWEDRKEHAEVFQTRMAEKLRVRTGVKTTVHYVPPTLP